MTDTATPEVDARRFTPNEIAVACAKRLARYADFDENWLAAIAERGIELAEDGAFTITTEGGQTFHLTVTERADAEPTQAAAQLREERAVAEARPHDDEHAIGDVIKCQQCGQQTRSISRGCSVCGLGMARLDEPGKDAGHVWMPYPDEPGRRCTCSIGHDHDEDPDDGPSQAQEVRAAADWPAEPVGDRYDELAADRHAEITEAERSEEVHGG